MITTDWQFAHPHALWLLLLLPLAAWWRSRVGMPPAVRIPSIADAMQVASRHRNRSGAFLVSIFLASLALLIIALARPRLVKGTNDVESKGIDIMLTLDVSGSMEAMDFTLEGKPANRLAVVKDVVGKFVTQRKDDRLSMVAFAGRAYLVAPLTHDENWIASRLPDITIGMVEDGTAIGSAIAASVDHLSKSEAKSRIVVLLTDGVNTAGSVNPITAAEAAKALGIRVYTIGCGTNGEAPFPVRTMFGTQMRNVPVEIDEKTLTTIADSTGGKYFRATDTASLEAIYATINQLETTPRKEMKYEEYEERFMWFLIPGTLLLVLEKILALTRFRRLP